MTVTAVRLPARHRPTRRPCQTFDHALRKLRALDAARRGSTIGRVVIARDARSSRSMEGSSTARRWRPDRGAPLLGPGTFTFTPRPTEQRLVGEAHRGHAQGGHSAGRLRVSTARWPRRPRAQFSADSRCREPAQSSAREIDYLSDRESRSAIPTSWPTAQLRRPRALLRARRPERRRARVFMVNPYEVESVRLPPGAADRLDARDRRRGQAAPRRHRPGRVRAPRAGGGDPVHADVAMPRTAPASQLLGRGPARSHRRQAVGPLVAFALFSKLVVDSARLADGSPRWCTSGRTRRDVAQARPRARGRRDQQVTVLTTAT